MRVERVIKLIKFCKFECREIGVITSSVSSWYDWPLCYSMIWTMAHWANVQHVEIKAEAMHYLTKSVLHLFNCMYGWLLNVINNFFYPLHTDIAPVKWPKHICTLGSSSFLSSLESVGLTKNHSLKALSTFRCPLMTCLGIDWPPCAWELQACPAMQSHRWDWLWFDRHQTSFQHNSSLHTHSLECHSSGLYWEVGLAVLVTGLRWAADGAFCPAAPMRAGREGLFMFHLLPPSQHPQRPAQMSITLNMEKAEMEEQTTEKKGLDVDQTKMCYHDVNADLIKPA